MKKISLILCMLIALVGCSSGSSDDIIGNWKLTSIQAGDTSFSGDELEAIYPEGVYYTFNEDNTLVIDSFGIEVDGSWSYEDSQFTFKNHTDVEIVITLEDGSASFEEGGMFFILELQAD